MTDAPHEPDSHEGEAGHRRPPPPSARAATLPSDTPSRDTGKKEGENRRRERGRRGGRSRAKRKGGEGDDQGSPRPTSARTMAQTEAPPAPIEPDVLEVVLQIDERAWVVRLLGRSGGSAPGATPLLLLGFWEAHAADGDAELETLVVGRTLSELSTTGLEDALSRATSYSTDRRRVELFAETSERRRR